MAIQNKHVIAYSHNEFDEICRINGWNDDNVDALSDKAFISIISSEECQKYYLEEDKKHWFKRDHRNVLNLEFDDISEDNLYKGHQFKAMTDEQAKRVFEFIENNIGKDLIFHCSAGVSRSGALCMFVLDMYGDMYIKHFSEICRMRQNVHVLSLLKRCYYEKYGFFFDNISKNE